MIKKMCTGLDVSYRLLFQILIKLEFPRQIFEKNSNIKFHGTPSIGGRVVRCWRTDGRTYRQDENNSRFRNFANASKVT
jgi:hypothetical protein